MPSILLILPIRPIYYTTLLVYYLATLLNLHAAVLLYHTKCGYYSNYSMYSPTTATTTTTNPLFSSNETQARLLSLLHSATVQIVRLKLGLYPCLTLLPLLYYTSSIVV